MSPEPATRQRPRLLDAGDAAFTIEFGSTIDPALAAAVGALDAAIARAQAQGRLPGLVETMPTFRSLTVFFDPLVTGRAALIDALQPLLDAPVPAPQAEDARDDERHWQLPVCYEPEMAPDLLDTAQALGVTPDALVAQHSATVWRVYMLGFLPGFPFMGDLPAGLHLPRRTQPRVRVPAGSVSIAGGLTAIYPWESPGGWHLVGRCPVRLFDPTWPVPALLAAGDRVHFSPVSAEEYQRLHAAVRAGELAPAHWRMRDDG
jgi:KipI family sensor histidine kinase inhibitor